VKTKNNEEKSKKSNALKDSKKMNLNPKNVQKELSVKDKQKSKGKENVDAISGLEVEEGISTSIQLPSLDYLLTQQTVSWYSISYA